jgi:hypothetical protein
MERRNAFRSGALVPALVTPGALGAGELERKAFQRSRSIVTCVVVFKLQNCSKFLKIRGRERDLAVVLAAQRLERSMVNSEVNGSLAERPVKERREHLPRHHDGLGGPATGFARLFLGHAGCRIVCYYCSTCYKAVRVGGGG